mgnify:CR=1 FL=1
MSTDTPHQWPAWVDAELERWAFEEAQERGRLAMAERCAAFGLALANGWLERRLWARAQWKAETEFLGIEWPPEASFVPLPADPDAVVAAAKLAPLPQLPILSAGDVAGDHIPALRRLLEERR